jgi:glycosyltransferase involved in cell wall biosynthesis
MKVLIWMNFPSHHQSGFFAALRKDGVDLRVCYYRKVSPERVGMGWDAYDELPPGENYVPMSLSALQTVTDWRERIHTIPGGHSFPFLRRLTAHLCKAGVQWVHWSERSHGGLISRLKTPLKCLYARKINRHALGALAIGAWAADEFRQWGVREEKIGILPYSGPVATSCSAPDPVCWALTAGRKAFLFLGSLHWGKGVDVLLKAFRKVADVDEEWILLFVGDDRSGGKYRHWVSDNHLDKRVLFLGPVHHHRVAGILQCARVLVLPSRHDGWGMALQEAAQNGLALVASDHVGAAHHLIDPGITGFRVKAGCTHSLTSALCAYVKEQELATKHGTGSRAICRSFSPEHNSARFRNLIHTWLQIDE